MARRCLLPRKALHLRRQWAIVGIRPFPRNRVPDLNSKITKNKQTKKNSRSLSTHGIIFKLSLTGRNAVQRFPWRCTYSQIYLHSRKCSSVNATPLPTILTTFQLKLCNLSFCTTKKYSSLPLRWTFSSSERIPAPPLSRLAGGVSKFHVKTIFSTLSWWVISFR